jgi:hypothetical protein
MRRICHESLESDPTRDSTLPSLIKSNFHSISIKPTLISAESKLKMSKGDADGGGKFNYRDRARVGKASEGAKLPLNFHRRSRRSHKSCANLRVLNQTQKVFLHKYLNFNTIFRNFSRVETTPTQTPNTPPPPSSSEATAKFSSAHFFHSLKHLRGEKHEISLPFLVIRLMLSLAKHQNVITAKSFSILQRQQRKNENENENSPSLEERKRKRRKITTRRRRTAGHNTNRHTNDLKIFSTRCCRGNATLGVKLRHIYICEEGVYTKHPSLTEKTRNEWLRAAAAWVDG